VELLVERPEPIPTLVIVGAGHIGRALARQARLLGFGVVVVDDRPELLGPETGLEADRVLLAGPAEGLREVAPDPWTSVVLVGPSHAHDEAGLREAIRSRAGYVGMIGSRLKVQAIVGQLLAEGFEPERLARAHAPIGLRIGAETPEEIALAILAEVVLVRKGAARADVGQPPLAAELVRAGGQ
jgi:xanthine dehydrogenase accessory factor